MTVKELIEELKVHEKNMNDIQIQVGNKGLPSKVKAIYTRSGIVTIFVTE